MKVMSIPNYHTLGRKASFYKSLAVWYLQARNLVVELRILTIDDAINRNQDMAEKRVKNVNEAP